jgi:hypothetical protein
MLIHNIFRPSVGADLSCTSPIHRPSVAFHDISLILLKHIIVPTADSSAIVALSVIPMKKHNLAPTTHIVIPPFQSRRPNYARSS